MAKLNQNQIYPATNQNDFFDLDKANLWNVIKSIFNLNGLVKTPIMMRVSGVGVINDNVNSISVANVGTVDGTFMGVVIKPNEVVNFNAGGLNNYFAGGTLVYEAIDGGGKPTELLITYIL